MTELTKVSQLRSAVADANDTIQIKIMLAIKDGELVLGSRTHPTSIEIACAVAQHLAGADDDVKSAKKRLSETGEMGDDALVEEDERDLRIQLISDSLVKGQEIVNPPELGGARGIVSYPPLSERDVDAIKAVMADAWTPERLDAARKVRDDNHAAYLADHAKRVTEERAATAKRQAEVDTLVNTALERAGVKATPAHDGKASP